MRKRRAATRLSHSMQLQRPTTPTDGETVPTFANVGTVRVGILPMRATERNRGDQIEAGITHKLLLRYRDDILPTWRIKWGLRLLNIVSIYDATGTRKFIVAECGEIPS